MKWLFIILLISSVAYSQGIIVHVVAKDTNSTFWMKKWMGEDNFVAYNYLKEFTKDTELPKDEN